MERILHGKATSLGAASGVVAGLVAITPACGAVNILGALIVGVVAGAACAYAVGLKFKFGLDDSLDVVGVHLVGGILGTVLIGFFATKQMVSAYTNGAKAGLFYGGGVDQLVSQIEGAGIVLVYSFVVSYVLGMILHKTIGMRISADAEVEGIDSTEHSETAYDWGRLAGSLRTALASAEAAAPVSVGAKADGSGKAEGSGKADSADNDVTEGVKA